MSKFEEAVNIVYSSYMKAEKYQDYNTPDSQKRNPSFTKDLILKYSQDISVNNNIVVTGSKGKGSVCTVLSNLLSSQFKVGVTTSPHIKTFADRFKIYDNTCNNIIGEEEFIEIVDSIKDEILQIDININQDECISPIGIQGIIALKYFTQNNTDINIFECGKGVKYDDINNIPHGIAILNTVFLEHTRELGGTVLEILKDKLSVVTYDTKCLYVGNIAKVSTQLLNYVENYITNNYPDCTLKIYGKDFYCDNIIINKLGTDFNAVINDIKFNLHIPLYGEHQAENVTLATAVYLDIIKQNITQNNINNILQNISVTGRLQILNKAPLLIVDTCINRESCKEIVSVLEKIYPDKKLNFILVIPDDKDYIGVCENILPLANKIILTKTKNPYYKFSDIQIENINKLNNLNIEILKFDDIIKSLDYTENEDCCILCTTGLLPEIL